MTYKHNFPFLFLSLFGLFLSSFAFGEQKDIITPEPQILVIFGATGDLSQKKLFPALRELSVKMKLPDHFACLGVGRSEMTEFEFKKKVLNSSSSPLAQNLFYVQANFNQDNDYKKLKEALLEIENRLGTKGNRIFYLATAASYFPTIIQKLKEHDLIYESTKQQNPWSRVIVEKPLGNDYASALDLRNLIFANLEDSQVYCIDHYLGKEVIQNLLTFRFSNPVFESLWNRDYIDYVKITLSEDIGIEGRGKFWEETGLLRDLVQNHAMQIVSLVAMEKPENDSSDGIHQEKIKLLQAIRPFNLENLESSILRGQYASGNVQGKEVCSYREEKNVAPNSDIETFVAARLSIETPRWEGVPFYIIAGKRLKEKLTEITIQFKPASTEHTNALIFRIQPNEEIALIGNSKSPESKDALESVKLLFNYKSVFQQKLPDAYERLLLQGMQGDKSLFVSFEEALISWKLYSPVLEIWKNHPAHFPNYSAGTEGPKEALNLFKKTLNLKVTP